MKVIYQFYLYCLSVSATQGNRWNQTGTVAIDTLLVLKTQSQHERRIASLGQTDIFLSTMYINYIQPSLSHQWWCIHVLKIPIKMHNKYHFRACHKVHAHSSISMSARFWVSHDTDSTWRLQQHLRTLLASMDDPYSMPIQHSHHLHVGPNCLKKTCAVYLRRCQQCLPMSLFPCILGGQIATPAKKHKCMHDYLTCKHAFMLHTDTCMNLYTFGIHSCALATWIIIL